MKQFIKKDKFDHPYKVNGKYEEEFVMKICYDFHFTSMDNEQLAAKYYMPLSSVRQLSSRYSPEELLAIRKAERKQFVVMFDEQYHDALMECLMLHKIPFDRLQDATVNLEYKSKL